MVNLTSISNKLKDNEYDNLEQQISIYLDNNASENSDIILELVKKTNSTILLEKAIKKSRSIPNPSLYLDFLINNNTTGKISPELLYDNILNYISEYPIKTLEIAIKYISKYYDSLTTQITLSNQVVIDFYELLVKNEEKIKLLTKSNSDLNSLSFFHFSLTDKNYILNVNELFSRYDFAFQSLVLKFYIKQYKLNKLSKDIVISILNSIEWIELSSLMIKNFITIKVSNKDELMNLMNQILKEHFKHLCEKKLTDSTLKNIFSIENLVKMCDGRKTYSGTTLWKGGDKSRIYTSGNHFVKRGEIEKMLCEGRFWKSEPFYNSYTNKPSAEQYDFYWCKNSSCVGVNDSVDFELSFDKWTLLEINELFQINLDRLVFVHLAGWLNRMKSIFDRMKCNDCNNYLRPKAYTPNLLGYYAVPLFICKNDQCISYNKEIRFTHCRGCYKILDSRECKVCSSCKWLICNDEKCSKCGCGMNHQAIIAEYP